MYKDKAYVCNRCRKVITYSLKQAGTMIPCPFCGVPANLPANNDFHPAQEARKKSRLLPCLFLIVAITGVGAFILVKPGHAAARTLQIAMPGLLANLYDHTTVAPEPARVRGVRATVAVTEVSYGCPVIFEAPIKKHSKTETPVCCVKLVISNTGQEIVAFRTWRIIEAFADAEKAILTDKAGRSYGLLSFGVGTYPEGSRQQADLNPGESITEQILFSCKQKPADDLEISLPCENLGGKGHLRFRIPRETIQ